MNHRALGFFGTMSDECLPANEKTFCCRRVLLPRINSLYLFLSGRTLINLNTKLKQLGISLLLILSLLGSTVSACVCSHHSQKPAEALEQSTCPLHQKAADKSESIEQNFANSCLVNESDCFCSEQLQRSIVKSEPLKLHKQAVATAELPVIAEPNFGYSHLLSAYRFPDLISRNPAFCLINPRGPPRA